MTPVALYLSLNSQVNSPEILATNFFMIQKNLHLAAVQLSLYGNGWPFLGLYSVITSCAQQQAANSLPQGEELPAVLVSVGWLLGLHLSKSLCNEGNMIVMANKKLFYAW